MVNKGLFDGTDGISEVQGGLGLDDGVGLRVVSAKFIDEQKFDWALFEGYDNLRVLTYSASVKAIVRMLDKYSFTKFECLFGYEGVLRDIKDILSFQKVVVGDTRAAIMGLKDERYAHILEKVHSGQVHFYVLRKYIAHAKLYLLSNADGSTRVIIGSANLSERAFSGVQPETIVKFDNDEQAWRHYNHMFDRIKDDSTDEIKLPKDRITVADIEITETPIMADTKTTLIISSPSAVELEETAPVQIERVEKILTAITPLISAAIPPVRGGKQKITPEIRRDISRIRLVKSAEEADNRYFSLDRVNRSAILSGEIFSLEWDAESVKRDANLLLNYFKNYEGAFEGNVPRMQRNYFIFMAWMYFSPLMCDMRSIALLKDSDVIRFPSFAVIYGKSNCGKTELVDTLMTSMFQYTRTIPKGSFTSSNLRALQQAYKRFPVVFDDIGRKAFNSYGKDMIKNEMQTPVTETPGFIISMNADPQSFPDEIVKRCMMLYTNTALPPHNEELRQRLQSKVKEIRSGLTGQLYRRYLVEVLNRLDDNRLPEDWLALSSGVLSEIISEVSGESLPSWCRSVTWLDYAEQRYDRVKARLDNLLRPSAQSNVEDERLSGWKIEGDKVIVWAERDAFGRREFDWADVPSTLIDDDATGGSRTVLHLPTLEGFIGRRLRKSRHWWKPWK